MSVTPPAADRCNEVDATAYLRPEDIRLFGGPNILMAQST